MTDATDPEGTARFKHVCEILDEIKRLERVIGNVHWVLQPINKVEDWTDEVLTHLKSYVAREVKKSKDTADD